MTTLMEPLAPWLRDLNRMFTSQGNQFVPPADVLVDDQGVTIYMDVPGLGPENLDVDLENDVLTVRGERPMPYAGENGGKGWRRIERPFGRFERSIRVPRGLDPDAIEAHLHEGVLTLRIPKPEELKPRRIQIREVPEGPTPPTNDAWQQQQAERARERQQVQAAEGPTT
jgi:HSP20 family protein